MSKYKDLEEMLEIISIAIVRQGTEEEFFRRSAQASTSLVAKNLLSELADDFNEYIKKLEKRRENIQTSLNDLKKNG